MDYIVRKGVLPDADKLLELDSVFFPQDWLVPTDFVEKLLKKNDKVYRVLQAGEKIKGFYALIPLNRESYFSILKGEILESDLYKHVIPYHSNQPIYLYLLTIISDQRDPLPGRYTRALLKDLSNFLTLLKNENITVCEIGSIAITSKGLKLAYKLGFEEFLLVDDLKEEYQTFVTTSDKLIQAVEKLR